MRNIILATLVALSFTSSAMADIVDDNLAKAQKGMITAQKRLDKATACQAIHDQCLADMKAKAEASVMRAQKKLAAFDVAKN